MRPCHAAVNRNVLKVIHCCRWRLRNEFLEDVDREKWLKDLDELDRIADSAISLVREEVENSGGELIRLDEMAQTIAQELASQGLPVVVRHSAPAVLLGAPLALTGALRNLFINAAVHGGGAQIDVEARAGHAIIVILDRGPGIPADLIDRVFEPFFRVDPSRHQAVPGAGLGLVIAKEIIRRIGGDLRLTNRREGGLKQEALFPAPVGSGRQDPRRHAPLGGRGLRLSFEITEPLSGTPRCKASKSYVPADAF